MQWFITTRHQLYWLLTMNAKFNEDAADFDKHVEDYTRDLKNDMMAYDEKIKAWGSNYLYYAIKMSYTECQSKGVGHNCNEGTYNGNGCTCTGTWRSNPNFYDGSDSVAQRAKASANPKSILIDGSLKTDCYYTPYSCPAG